MNIYAISEQGTREYQEDRYNVEYDIYDGYDYLSIFDGHGGDKVAIWMQIFHKDILKSLLITDIKPEEALKKSIEIVKDLLPKAFSMRTGCTAIIILKKNDKLWCCNIGDCRAIINNDDEIIELSRDHKPNRDDERDRIEKLGGSVIQDNFGIWRVNGNLAISRAIGDKYLDPYVIEDPEIIMMNINQNNKYLIMASDGLWDVLDNNFVMHLVCNEVLKNQMESRNGLMRLICLKLLKLARYKLSGDNITIIIAFL